SVKGPTACLNVRRNGSRRGNEADCAATNPPAHAGGYNSRTRSNPEISCGVAQSCTLLYRRIAFCGSRQFPALPVLSTRCRLQIGDTAECNSALRAFG